MSNTPTSSRRGSNRIVPTPRIGDLPYEGDQHLPHDMNRAVSIISNVDIPEVSQSVNSQSKEEAKNDSSEEDKESSRHRSAFDSFLPSSEESDSN